MILGNFKLFALGIVFAGFAVPALAAEPSAPARAAVADANHALSAGRESVRSSQPRRVELPFPLDVRPVESQSAPAPRESEGPHPYREIHLKRASLDFPATPSALRLSRFAEFG